MWPLGSAAGPFPDIHAPELMPFGEKFNTASCASDDALKDIIQPCQGLLSQCAAQSTMTCPLVSSRAERWLLAKASNETLPPMLATPVPGTVADMRVGP